MKLKAIVTSNDSDFFATILIGETISTMQKTDVPNYMIAAGYQLASSDKINARTGTQIQIWERVKDPESIE